jgi:hypothetical protein
MKKSKLENKVFLSLLMNKENKKILDWNGRKVSQFLIWDYIEHMNKINYYNTQNFINNSFRIATQKYKKYKIILDLIDNIYSIIFSLKSIQEKNDINRKILFNVAGKYPPILLTTKKSHSVEMIAKGKEDRLFAIQNFIKYTSYTDLNQFVYNYLIKKNEYYLYKLIDNIKERIKRTNPDYIVLWNDSLPIERAIVLASKEIGIPTIIIQHGIYSSISPLFDGKVADYILVWGQYFKDLYIKKSNRNPENIYVLGYPYSIEKNEVSNKKNKRYTVYYLGQNFERYNKKLLDIKIKTIEEINKICNKLGMKFIYRLHPGDDKKILKTKLPKVPFTSKSEKLTETFNKGDIFISFNSTSLVEAAMRSKISLQLINYPLKTDNFEELGVCSKSFKTIEELENYLMKIADSQDLNKFKLKFNNDYIELSYELGKRFLEILNEIEKKNDIRRKP